MMEKSEEEMIREEEITWKEAESAKQQQEEELDEQAAEDEDEARLAAHLDHEYTLDTSEWDQANPRDYGTPSPVRRWRDDLMAKRERDEEEENRIIQSAEDNEDEKLLEDRKELGEKYDQHTGYETPEDESDDDQGIMRKFLPFWSDDYLHSECKCGECSGGDLANDCWHADEHAVNLHIEAEEEEKSLKQHPIYRGRAGPVLHDEPPPRPDRAPPVAPLPPRPRPWTQQTDAMSIDALISDALFNLLELKDLCRLWTTATKWWNRWKDQHKAEVEEKRQQHADNDLWHEVEEERVRQEHLDQQAQIEADHFLGRQWEEEQRWMWAFYDRFSP